MSISIKQRIRWKILTLLYYFMRVFPIKKNRIVISNFYGRGFGDNGKYIAKALLSQGIYYDIVWLTDKRDDEMPDEIRITKYLARGSFSLRTIYEEATAKVWIDNCRKEPWVRKRKKQYYIQTWHGDMGSKKAEGDIISSLSETYIMTAKNDSSMADLFISGNRWFCERIKKAYWYYGEIALCGYPRRDCFFGNNKELNNKIRERLLLSEQEKVVLYAPTFRNDCDNLDVYKMDWHSLIRELEDKFGGKWKALIRLHPNVASRAADLRIPDCVSNVTNYPDMQELLLVADCCISDYSSCIYEFALRGKPGFIYASDFEQYKCERDYYLQPEELPFQISQSKSELFSHIRSFDETVYAERVNSYLRNILEKYPEGNASEYLAEIIFRECTQL